MHVEELDTPVAVVDLDRLDANIVRLQQYMDEHGIVNRPHIKTHKIPEIAWLQLDQGARGITCQKLGEAEVMAEAGIRDIFLPYNILGSSKLSRLLRLARETRISVTADSETTVRGLSETFAASGTELPVLVEFDTGARRCGVQTPGEAAELARKIDRAGGLVFGGLMTYPMNDATDAFVEEARDLLSSSGMAIDRVSAGGSHCMWQVHFHKEVTEYRAGMYVYGDRYTVKSGAMTFDQCSFFIHSTVVSRPTSDRAILDAGSKSLSSDLLNLQGHGLILEYPEAVIASLSEEHGHVDLSGCPSKPSVGDPVTIIPNHCCVANNLFNEIIGARGGEVEVTWNVRARGKVQ